MAILESVVMLNECRFELRNKVIALGLSVVVSLLTAGLPGASSHAAQRTFVSGIGTDGGTCTRAAPCLTFAFAYGQTDPGGEINCVDVGNFGPVTIAKSISIDCGGTLGGIIPGANEAITINSPSAVVRLRNLSLNGNGAGLTGVRFLNGVALFIENCTI